MRIEAATFNVKRALRAHSGRNISRIEAVGAFFAEESPDVVGTQELTLGSINRLASIIPEYDWVGTGRSENGGGEYAAIFYKSAVFEPVAHGTFWLSKNPLSVGSRGWFSLYPRICTWCALKNKSDGAVIKVYNTHLDNLSPIARLRGLQLIDGYSAENDGDELIGAVLMGDFNAGPASAAMRGLMPKDGSGRWSGNTCNALLSSDNPPGSMRTFHGFRGRSEGEPIDYILTSKNLFIRSARIVRKRYMGMYPSDHYPVIAEIYG